MPILQYLLPPIIGGIIALSTNWLAIKMLFRPHKAKYIFGIKLPFTPGLIPKERARLTAKIAEAISSRLLTPDVLAAEISNPDIWPIPNITIREALATLGVDGVGLTADTLKRVSSNFLPRIVGSDITIPQAIDEKLAELTGKVIDDNLGTVAKMFISKEKVYDSIKTNFFAFLTDPSNYNFIESSLHSGIDALFANTDITSKLLNLNIRDGLTGFLYNKKHVVTHMLSVIAAYVAQNMPIQTMIENKLASFDVAEAEEVILGVAGRELRMIIWLGGLLGFIIGWVMVLL